MAGKRKSPLVFFILIMRSIVVGVAYQLVRGGSGPDIFFCRYLRWVSGLRFNRLHAQVFA